MTSMPPLAATVTIAQGLALTAVSAYAGGLGLLADTGDAGVSLLLVAFGFVGGCWGLFLLTGGIGMTGRRRWGRIPTVVAQLPLVLAPLRLGVDPTTIMALALPAAVVLFAIMTTTGRDSDAEWA